MTERPLLILASNSPRRQELLALGNWMFSVIASNADESRIPGEAPRDYVLRLAEAKARASARLARPEHIVIAADTAVVDGDKILGKPSDMIEAASMLKSLRGHTHQVFTGLTALRVSDGMLVRDLCVTDVPMRNYSDEEIDAYVLTGDPLDKAGAYAIQHPRFQPVEKMEGCYASVMGLPLCHLVRTLRLLEVQPRGDMPVACQTHLNYQCPVSESILNGEAVQV
ncbi:MAG: Maf family protein [Chloroflexota bacterium]